ncbi:MAG: mevalonate kinase [Coxiellaceae bacterium]|jgi:mevalonate kinase|nr:mevalonate kinase [Coxiellaceae bacterium]
MGYVSYKVIVPGSLMLLGEHAVLHRKQAVVVAINRSLSVSLIPRTDRNISIISKAFGKYLVALDKLKIVKPYDYVLAAVQQYLPKMKSGCTLKISADFSATIGLGSSAAVTVAILGVLYYWLNKKKINLIKLCNQAINVIRLVQGFGSGADVAASIFGGILAYKIQPLAIKKLGENLPLVAIYSGSKFATSKVVSQVERRCQQFPRIFANLYNTIDDCVKEGIAAIKNNQWIRLGQIMNLHQGLQEALGVSNTILAELIFSLRKHPKIYGAKISGSGLGDCVIGLGQIKKNSFPENIIQKKSGVRQINIKISPRGLVYL